MCMLDGIMGFLYILHDIFEGYYWQPCSYKSFENVSLTVLLWYNDYTLTVFLASNVVL